MNDLTREEEALRRVLARQAADVDVEARALAEIRQRIAARCGHRWLPGTLRGGIMIVSPAAVLAGLIIAIVLGLGAGAPAPPDPAAPSVAGSATGSPTGSATGDPSTSAAPDPAQRLSPGRSSGPGPGPGAGAVAVPVYYVGATARGPLLYREFHRRDLSGGGAADKARAAVADALDGRSALDPDYTSAWPAGAGVRAVRVDGDVVTVDLTGTAAGGVDPAAGRQAVQQLVWTATAASGAAGVRLLFDGAPLDTLWAGVPVAGVLRRASAVDVLAPVWLIEPQHGAVVSATFTVHVAGIVVEAAAQLRVRDNAGVVVDQRPIQLDQGPPAQGEHKVTLTLPPGEYTVEAYHGSAADGTEQFPDAHRITVR